MKHTHRLFPLLLAGLLPSVGAGCVTPMRYARGGGAKFETRSLAYGGAAAVLVQTTRNNKPVACLLPPAQAAATLTFKGGIKSTASTVPVEANVEGSTAITQLFAQSAASLHLQMAAWRLCEAYMNGIVSAAEYKVELVTVIEAAAQLATTESQRQVARSEEAKASVETAKAEATAKVETAKERTKQAAIELLRQGEAGGAGPLRGSSPAVEKLIESLITK
jgi:hypothetical protein